MVSTSTPNKLASEILPRSAQRNAQIVAIIAMASFGMLFGTLVLSFLLAQARNTSWPPIGVAPINKVYAYLSTGVIAASSLLYAHARQSQDVGEFKSAKWALFGTLTLAVIFLRLQYITLQSIWGHGQGLSSDIYSGSVHLLIGLHAIHILAGIAGLSYVGSRLFFTKRPASQTTTQIVGWFWHFLGFLWVLIFLVLVL